MPRESSPHEKTRALFSIPARLKIFSRLARTSVSGGANPLWLAEWLAERLVLKPGMKVLDLGCGRAASSIFLCREYGLQIWATDLWFNVSENFNRIRDAGVQSNVFPLHADARSQSDLLGQFDSHLEQLLNILFALGFGVNAQDGFGPGATQHQP